jgi:hypothetical protein
MKKQGLGIACHKPAGLQNSKLPALKGGASRKGKYLFQIASLYPGLKGGVKGSEPVM